MIKEVLANFFTIDRLISLVRILVGLFGIYLATKIAIYLGQKFLARFFLKRESPDERRKQTLYTLSQSILRYLLYIVALVAALGLFNVNAASLIAAAGIGGLAIGLGAQNLVRDLVAGFFILLEDQFAVGDLVTIGAAEGIVEQIGIRTTSVRDLTGKLYIFPNGQIASLVVQTPSPWVILDYDIDEQEQEKLLAKLLPLLPRWRGEIGNVLTRIRLWPLATKEKHFLRFAAQTTPSDRFRVERELAKRIENLFAELSKEGKES